MGHVTMTTPLSEVICHPWLELAKSSLFTKFEVANSIRYEDMKSDAIQNVENWVIHGS